MENMEDGPKRLSDLDVYIDSTVSNSYDHNGETEDYHPAPHTNRITCVTDM